MALKELCRWCWEARRAHGLSQEGLGAVNKHICPSILELGKALVALSYKMGPVHTDGEDSRAGLNPQQNQRLNWLRHSPGRTRKNCSQLSIYGDRLFFPAPLPWLQIITISPFPVARVHI